jgi:hypothetical protein
VLQQESRGRPYANSFVEPLLKPLFAKAVSPVNMCWDNIVATSVLPRLLEMHTVRRDSTRNIWHAEPDSGAQLARLLLATRAGGPARYVDSLLQQGAGFNALYREVFEPAQLHLGKLWDADRCDDFQLSIGLARLNVQVRRMNAAAPSHHAYRPGHSVLLCAQPGESHSVGVVMSSEVFDRNGWDVTCEFPSADQSLLDTVHERWFDVLKLSQSGSLRRDSRLISLRDTIDAARVASLNPALMVVVDGRTFAETPRVYRAVHADAVSCSVLDAVPIAERLLDVSRSLLSSVQVTAS